MHPNNKNDLESIRRYYDANTPRFLTYGGQRKTRTIHRPVWGEGVQDEEQALHYIHKLILRECHSIQNADSGELQVLDLGCGVGASLFYLAQNLGEALSGVGLTLSPVQAKIALQAGQEQNLTDQCMFIVGNFQTPPLGRQFDLLFSIESFVYTNHPKGYFQAAARLLKPGGRLVLCDDFLAEDNDKPVLEDRHQRWLELYQKGWGVNGLWSPEYVENLAASVDLMRIEVLDLTPSLQLNPLPEKIFGLLSSGFRALANDNQYMRSVMGGQALQLCLAQGLVEYRYLVFELKSDGDE